MLRKLLSLTLTIALLATFCTFPVSAASPSIGVHSVNAFSGTVKATNFVADSNVKIVGRNNPANPLVFAWHASGIEFDVTGTKVVGVRLKDYDTTTRSDMKHDICLNVTINGEAITTDGKSYTEIYDYGEANTNWLANNPHPDKNCFEVQNDGLEHDYIFATNLDPNKTYTVKVTLAHENWGQYQHYAFWAVSALTDNVFVVFDLETTGLAHQPAMGKMDKIIEIGAVSVEDGVLTENMYNIEELIKKIIKQIITYLHTLLL